jgi:hypothetical protein
MPALSVEEVTKELQAVHREFQRNLGENDDGVSEDCRPLIDLPGFDSTLIPLLIRTVAKRLGVSLPQKAKVTNLYVSGHRRLSVREVAEGFHNKYGEYANG